MFTLSEYQKEPGALSMAEFAGIYASIISAVGTDPDGKELYKELLEKAVEYAYFRARWNLMTVEERMEADAARTRKHDSLIIKFNMLARYCRMQGKDDSWREKLGDADSDPYFRKRIGDMGCYLAFAASLEMR